MTSATLNGLSTTVFAGSIFCLMATASAAELDVYVEGLRSNKGSVALCLWSDRTGFPDCSKSRSAQKRTVSAGRAGPVVFKDLPAGMFAITLIHDENANGKFDTNFVGIPTEGAGASNNSITRFGPPGFQRSLFSVNDQAKQRIKIIYWLNQGN